MNVPVFFATMYTVNRPNDCDDTCMAVWLGFSHIVIVLAGVTIDDAVIYLARTSFQGAGTSTACGSRSLVATVCSRCRALLISSAVAPACRLYALRTRPSRSI